jgi:hypothetical protein
MRAASSLLAIGTALCLAAPSAHALGFGRVVNATQLGQTLNFAAVVRLESDESLSRECVSAEVQSGDNKLHPSQVRATLEVAPDSAERFVRVTTSVAIDEPVITVSVTAGCTAKITRRFVAFIDPPLVNLAQGGEAAAVTLPPQRNDSQVSPVVGIVQGDEPASARTPRSGRAPATRGRPRPAPVARVAQAGDAIEPAAAPARKNPLPRRSANGSQPAAAAGTGPRLRLEAAPAAAARPASSPLADAVSALASAEAASAAALAKDQADQLAKERQRIQVLEEGLAKLRSDSQATQKSLAAMQARLKEAESERYANPVVYALAWLSGLLALAVAGLLWRQSRGGPSTQWWTAPPPPAATVRGDVPPMVTPSIAGVLVSQPRPLDEPSTGPGAFDIPTVIDDDDAPRRPPLSTPPSLPVTTVAVHHPAAEPVRELSVEELIDLEQQADFFIVLGQDDAAIELLMSHVRSDGGISPLPYLKLLEIYRRRGENEAYERIRDRFNRRFNAYAPDWDADLQQGRSLVDYPDSIARLQALWATPTRAMETLDASLFRRNKTDDTFDLPAYRELLFLYSISRDLAEHGSTAPVGEVDLLLPLNDDPDAEPISRLSATTAAGDLQNNEVMMTMPLDLDVSFGPGDRSRESGDALRRTAEPPAATSNLIDFNLDVPYTPVATKPPSEGG